uniref:dipeptidyl-peptidase IV n=1 Tax=Naja naja TaxID=35670 RepID=A0A8C6XH31_NAJNA
MRSAMKTEQPTLEIFETAEGKQNVAAVEETAKLEPYYVERYSWSHLKKLLADTRKYHSCLMAKTPHDFTFVKRNDPECSHSDRVYYLAMSGENRENILFYSEIPKTVNKAAILLLSWKPLIDLFQASLDYGMKRIGTIGIASYNYHRESGTFLFQAGSGIYHVKDGGPNGFTQQPLQPNLVETSCPNIRMDPKICPADPNWIAFIHSNDIWISNLATKEEQRLTFVHKEHDNVEEDPKSAGVATFVLQEEFDRYTGYWWCPAVEPTVGGGKILRILYEENDESEVEVIHVTSPMLETRRTDSFRYPKTGTANPKVTFKLSEITLGSDGRILSAVDKELVQPFEILFDGIEYIARAGWTREGKYAWAILLDQTTDIWINIHDIFHVFPQTQEDVVEFIFASECKTGFRHLYRISTVLKESKYRRSSGGLPAPSDFLCHVKEELPLTSGEWEVLGRHGSDIRVDEVNKLVYFEGTKDSPLEHHLYRLTERGFSHACFVSQDCDMVICKFSNQKCPHQVSLYKLTGLEEGTAQRAKEFWATILHSSGSLPDYVPPEVFSFESSSGFVLYGMIYKPHDLQPGKKYPTVLFIYGGPQVAVAGAPVTLWLFYDTGYTERYMGHPDNNEQAYYLGSVAMQAEKFPSEPNRLLLLHGFLDENVHFAHTSILLSFLVRAGKPYDLQIYPQERHSIRVPESGEHYELHLLYYLQENLGSRMATLKAMP